MWDCIIVGAGPAGLSAAVYMGRFKRRTLVLDAGDGRWSYGQRNENYLGFPNGVSARRLHRLGRAQAERFGVKVRDEAVRAVAQEGECFRLETQSASELARTLIWAAGVRDHWPGFPGARSLVGKHLFWCIVCDGWRTRERSVLIMGNDDHSAGTALQFLTYTRDLTFLVDPAEDCLSAGARAKLEADGMRMVSGTIARVERSGHDLGRVRLRDGTTLGPELLFSLLGSSPRTELLAALPLELASNGHIWIDDKNHTSLPNFFAAGDVTNKHSHQVVSAAHEGAMAAQAANHVLYPSYQRLES